MGCLEQRARTILQKNRTSEGETRELVKLEEICSPKKAERKSEQMYMGMGSHCVEFEIGKTKH